MNFILCRSEAIVIANQFGTGCVVPHQYNRRSTAQNCSLSSAKETDGTATELQNNVKLKRIRLTPSVTNSLQKNGCLPLRPLDTVNVNQ